MEHLNYCRKMAKQFRDAAKIPSLDPVMRERVEHCLTLAGTSEKFLLPDGGFLFDDLHLGAIDETMPLRLPFRNIAIEFANSYAGPLNPGEHRSSKRIIFANDDADETSILMRSVCYMDSVGTWVPSMTVSMPRVNFIDRSRPIDGLPALRLDARSRSPDWKEELQNVILEARVVLGLLNALACSNVHTERQAPSKVRAAMLKKGALPFDSYHILTVDVPRGPSKLLSGSGAIEHHRSPREHLRRGHIRRLADGKRIWVNACLVSAGNGGKVSKDYAVRSVRDRSTAAQAPA